MFNRLRRGIRWTAGHVPPRTPRTWDAVLAVAALVLFIVTWATVVDTHQVSFGTAPAVAALTVIPLALARRNPITGWGITIAVGLLFWTFFEPSSTNTLPWTVPHLIVLFVLAVAVALLEPLPRVLGAWLGSALVLALLMPDAARDGLVFGLTSAMVVALLLRWLILSRLQLARQEEVSELERARRAVLEERSRIARDLHDVVAHRMSLVVVQAQSAPVRLGSVSPEVEEEFRSISEQARAALNEVRGMLGVLRSEDADAPGSPQQGTRDVEPLLRQTRSAGVHLEWTVTGDPAPVGESVGMVVYRILQEALANASRHAPSSHVQVDVDYADPVRVTVRSTGGNGDAAGTPEVGTGTGIIGMTDRARAVGGTLEAEPVSGGGFLVRATLPRTAGVSH